MYLLVSLCFVLAASSASPVQPDPECPSLTSEQINELNSLAATFLSESQVPVREEFIVVYAPKPIVKKDPHTCIRKTFRVINEDEIVKKTFAKGDWFATEKKYNTTLKKVSTGVYLVYHKSKAVAKFYNLFSDNDVIANFLCLLPTEKKHRLQSVTTISVRKDALTSPIGDVVQASIAEARKKVEGSAHILGEIVALDNPCRQNKNNALNI